MTELNIIHTIEEYMEQGFTETEAYAMRVHDRLFNKWVRNGYHLPEKEDEKMAALVKGLGL